MNRCDFEFTDREGEYRCRRCGALRSSPHPPARTHRGCNVIDLTPREASRGSDRGLGDTVARLVDAVTFGHGDRIASALAERLGHGDCGCDGRREWLNQVAPYRDVERAVLDGTPSSLLLRMPHGLGDAVQLTVVLRHLRHYYPEWSIDVAAKVGAHTLFNGLCRAVYRLGAEPAEKEYALASTLAWDEPEGCFADSPATKAERCLREVFHLQPLDSLCRYQVAIGESARQRAGAYLAEVTARRQIATFRKMRDGRERAPFPSVLFHYQGNSATQRKALDETLVAAMARRTIERGLVPIVLDWDGRHGLGTIEGLFCPDANHALWQQAGTGDGETLAALIDQSLAMVAIDSGPGHIAGATGTPTLVVWTGHHPLQFYALADNVRHATPIDHADKLRGAEGDCLQYFASHYDYRLYADPRRAIPLMFDELLDRSLAGRHEDEPELTVDADLWIRQKHLEADRTIVRDVYIEDCYGVDRLPWQPRYVVDIGAHLGAFARRVQRRLAEGGRLICVEPDHRNLSALRRNVGDIATIVSAACTDLPAPVRLRSTVYDGTDNTGGSTLAEVGEIVPQISFDELLATCELPWVDLLKLDCEGCEFSILSAAREIDRVRLIVGEWHDRERFLILVAERFSHWRLTILREGPMGLFWLENPRFAPSNQQPAT